MGTAAIIKVEGIKYAALYKNWDGYPEATLEWLETFNKDFGKDRPYKLAQLIRSSVRDADKFKLGHDEKRGWGVVEPDAWGAEYEYTLKDDGSVEVTKNV